MNLIDFLNDEDFNRLRQQMGTNELGRFELFEPTRQLTWNEREALAEQGLSLVASEIRIVKDKTLAYKNTRVWALSDNAYHLAYCLQMQQLRHHQTPLQAGTHEWPVSREKTVCLECLALLQYQGIDVRRLRRTEFSEHVSEHFSLAGFQKEYPFYPV